MKIAILGTRGVPASYGGFETFAAELSTRLVARGHEVHVYCREERPAEDRVVESSSRQVVELEPTAGSEKPGLDGSGETARVTRQSRLEDSKTRRLDHSIRDHSIRDHSGGARDNRQPTTDNWMGVQRIVLPAIGHKYLETVSHAFLSALDALRRDFDAVLVCNAANAFVIPLLRAARIPVAVNVDGIERKRRKWNILGRAVYAIGEAFSAAFANRVIADAEVIARYYREHYALEPAVIPYGADFPAEDDTGVLERLGLRSRGYILYVSRFEPENNPLEVVQAYEQAALGGWRLVGDRVDESTSRRAPGRTSETAQASRNAQLDHSESRRLDDPIPLVMLGKGLYAADLVRELHAHASDRVLFPGALYGRDYRTLQRNALLYIQATEVGGTHPALIEAMGSGGVVLAHDTPENREVGGDAVGYFHLRPSQTLSGTLSEWLADGALRQTMRLRARQRAGKLYSWERVTDSYEALFGCLSRR